MSQKTFLFVDQVAQILILPEVAERFENIFL